MLQVVCISPALSMSLYCFFHLWPFVMLWLDENKNASACNFWNSFAFTCSVCRVRATPKSAELIVAQMIMVRHMESRLPVRSVWPRLKGKLRFCPRGAIVREHHVPTMDSGCFCHCDAAKNWQNHDVPHLKCKRGFFFFPPHETGLYWRLIYQFVRFSLC